MKLNFQKNLLAIILILFFYAPSIGQNSKVDYSLLFKKQKIQLEENFKNLESFGEILPQEIMEGKIYRLVQFYEIPDATMQRNLKDHGVELLYYIPNKAYLASIPIGLSFQELKIFPIRSFSKIKKEWKESEVVRSQIFDDWAIEKKQVKLTVAFFKNLSKSYIERQLKAERIMIRQSSEYVSYLEINVPIEKVASIASLPFIFYVDQIGAPHKPEQDEGRSLHKANVLDSDFPTGRHYDGTGVKILVRDDGAVGPHIDFHGRTFQDLPGGNTHGDRVAGVATGAGNLDPVQRGSAKGADLYVSQYVNDFMDGVLELHQNEGVLLTNSSYGNGCNAGYTETSATVDFQIFQNPTLAHIFSTGNSGNSNCDYGAGAGWGNITGGHKIGKNAISVGSLRADGSLVASSSRGPAEDGRIKPDICANGVVSSTLPDNDYTQETSGTSFAAPSLMGVMAQLYQAYQELTGNTPESALIKAVMLNTANDINNEGPDFSTGWGAVNGYRAVRLLEDGRYLDSTIDQGELNTHDIMIPSGVQQVKFMLYWMDHDAVPGVEKGLVNDLDLVVNDPSATSHLPWILDPFPNPTTLALPAIQGIDRLNNMEQVTINQPAAGTYSLDVSGFELPFGNLKYYIVYEIITDEIKITYPNGGEGLVPGENLNIHWDAYDQTGDYLLEYSVDSGGVWNNIASVNGTERIFEWSVPSTSSGQVLFKITNGNNSDISDAPLTISVLPTNVSIDTVCYNSILVSWTGITAATAYEVFRLGEKYMEPVGITSDLEFEIPITNPTTDNWFAVRALGVDNLTSRRTLAIGHTGDLLNCVTPTDIANREILNPSLSTLEACGAISESVMIQLENTGTTSESNFEISYQFNNEPIVTEIFMGTIDPGMETSFTFTTPIDLSANGNYDLKTWVSATNDPARYNDTLATNFDLLIQSPIDLDVMEDFESNFPPTNWRILNPDESLTWDSTFVVGSAGDSTNVTFINNFNYNALGQQDQLVSIPLNIPDTNIAILSFDLSYTPYSQVFSDTLQVEIYTNCGAQLAEVIFREGGDDLMTISESTTDRFEPTSAADWENISLDLSAFAGDSITIKFVQTTGYGNMLYLDNINVFATVLTPPIASFAFSNPTVCVGDVVEFSNTSMANSTVSYAWSFGTDAMPYSNSDLEGPHAISFANAGTQNVTLWVSNSAGIDSITQSFTVEPQPEAAFIFMEENGAFTFQNNSLNADSYIWDFGDGNTDTGTDPTHTYSQSDTYTITLSAYSELCDETVTFEQTVNVVITNTQDLNLDFKVNIFPNPNDGLFNLTIESLESNDYEINLYDLNGRQLNYFSLNNISGTTNQLFDLTHLSDGIYFVKIKTQTGVLVEKIVIEH